MNKKGVAAFYYFMIGILFFLLGLALAPALITTTDETTNYSGNSTYTQNLDCSNSSISNQDKSVCYQLDSIPAVYVGIIFGFGGIIILRLMGG